MEASLPTYTASAKSRIGHVSVQESADDDDDDGGAKVRLSPSLTRSPLPGISPPWSVSSARQTGSSISLILFDRTVYDV